MVLFVIDYATCKVEIPGIITQADGQWMKQIARQLSDPFTGLQTNRMPLLVFQRSQNILPVNL